MPYKHVHTHLHTHLIKTSHQMVDTDFNSADQTIQLFNYKRDNCILVLYGVHSEICKFQLSN